MTRHDAGRRLALVVAIVTPWLGMTTSAQGVGELIDYRAVRDRVAVFGNFRVSGVDGIGPKNAVLMKLSRFGVRQVVDVNELGPWYFGNRGLIVDGQAIGWWRSPTFEEFLTKGKLRAVVDDYVETGGVLIVSYPAVPDEAIDRLPPGSVWAPRGFRAVPACDDAPEPEYEFAAESPLARHLERTLTGSRGGVLCGLGFDEAEGWTPLMSIRGRRVPVLIERQHGAGRILVFGEPLGITSDDPDANARTEGIIEAFLRYIATFSATSELIDRVGEPGTGVPSPVPLASLRISQGESRSVTADARRSRRRAQHGDSIRAHEYHRDRLATTRRVLSTALRVRVRASGTGSGGAVAGRGNGRTAATIS